MDLELPEGFTYQKDSDGDIEVLYVVKHVMWVLTYPDGKVWTCNKMYHKDELQEMKEAVFKGCILKRLNGEI